MTADVGTGRNMDIRYGKGVIMADSSGGGDGKLDLVTEAEVDGKEPFEEPKLTFVKPKLVRHGSVSEVTAGFFGPFYP